MNKIVLLISLFIFPFSVLVAEESYTFRMPDVRNDYCGIHVNYQYCKCAFHGDYCNAVNQSESGARRYVMGGFKTWTGDKIEAMARNCLDEGHHWNAGTRTCTHTPDEKAEPKKTLTEEYNLPPMEGVPEPVRSGYYGKIAKSEGEVFIYQWSFKRWIKAIPGMPIYQGDFIKTLSGDTRIIYNGRFGDDVLNLSSEAILNTGRRAKGLDETPEDDETNTSLLGILEAGAVELYNDIQQAQEGITVPTWYRQLYSPNVAPGIRGSHVIIAYNQRQDETFIAVNEGLVELPISNATSGITLLPGNELITNGMSVATSTTSDWSEVTINNSLPSERVNATPEELTHTAPPTPVDTENQTAELPREELIGDLSELDKQFEERSLLFNIVLILIVLGVGYWFFFKRKVRD